MDLYEARASNVQRLLCPRCGGKSMFHHISSLLFKECVGGL